jgi:hypothetical protein
MDAEDLSLNELAREEAPAVDVLGHPVFLRAVAFAKGMALHGGSTDLSPRLLLAGFARLLGADPFGADEAIRMRGASLTEAIGRAGLTLDASIEPITHQTLPVTTALQGILRARASSLGELLDALLEHEGGDPGDTALIEAVAQRASRAAAGAGLRAIGPELFAAAAYFAYLEGAFLQRAGLSMQIALRREALESLIARRRWSAADFAPAEGEALPLNDTLQTLADGEHPDGQHVLEMIGAGVAGSIAEMARLATAYHEAGHAVALFMLRPARPITQLSVIADDGLSGWLSPGEQDHRSRSPNWSEFLDELVICLAGRAAQQIRFGCDTVDVGSESDLERATRTAWRAIAMFGMDPEFGPVSVSTVAELSGGNGHYLADAAQRRLLEVMKDAASRTEQLLRENWAGVERIAIALAEKRFLDADDIIALLSGQGLAQWPGVRTAWSVPQPREVRFAPAPGVCETREGPARYETGDAIVTGDAGESWCTTRAYFDANYEPVEGTEAGQDGTYAKRRQEVLVFQLGAPRRIPLSGDRGILSGKAGDWVVDYGSGNLAIVAQELFPQYFTLDPGVL